MPIYQIVLTNLKLPSQSNPEKSIADVILDGSYTKADLELINKSIAFPTNNYNRLRLPEGAYSSADAMMQFVRTIGPFLSDQALYKLTHMLADIETDNGKNQSAYRNSTLAKCFIIYELERHADYVTKEKPIPNVFLSHMQVYIVPLCQQQWPQKLQDNVDRFGTFNFKNELMDKSASKKFQAVGCDVDIDVSANSYQEAILLKSAVEQNFPFYPLVEKFKAEELKVEELSTASEKQPSEFSPLLQLLEKSYKEQKEEKKEEKVGKLKETSKAAKNMFSNTGTQSAPVGTQSAPTSPVIGKSKKRFSLNPATWFGSPDKHATSPTVSKKIQKYPSTFSINPPAQQQPALRENPTPLTEDKRRLRNTQSFMGSPPLQVSTERTIEMVQQDLDICISKLSHYTKQHADTAESVTKLSPDDNSTDATSLRDKLTLYAKRKKHYLKKKPLLEQELKILQASQPENKRKFN